MNVSYASVADEYAHLLGSMTVTKPGLDALCVRLISIKTRYLMVEASTRVPAAWLLAVDYREGENDPHTYFGNGDPLNRVTHDVPRGRGPFTGIYAWEDGCEDALHLDHIDQVIDWEAPRACYEGEAWNGFGVRAHGRHSGYVWAGTNIYTGGGYPRDGQWDASYHDSRFGIAPIMLELGKRDPQLALSGWPMGGGEPVTLAPPQSPPNAALNTSALQRALNDLGRGPVVVDGSFGRQTRQALKAFQHSKGLDPDGIVGPITMSAIRLALKKPDWPA